MVSDTDVRSGVRASSGAPARSGEEDVMSAARVAPGAGITWDQAQDGASHAALEESAEGREG
ncbi:hypothetical protein GCM10009530_60240 [Microbispora corallina]|uniref:Uncharacterized protein n=1 Tax=Microbispora corallina TaxID=83302 RepID=A0ABQ4FYY0_9ACTN|nr:hypothetical protein Mco01_30100 [Microbispora corallina]